MRLALRSVWSASRRSHWASLSAFVLLWAFATATLAQAPAASGGATPALSEAQLNTLVGPIALYPDDLVAIILPASTYPLEIVQADRFLEKRKSDKNLQVNAAWHDPIKALLNYPDVVKKMSADLDWTSELGEAVVADQGAVLNAIQVFRRKVNAAGNLKSDDKQTVIVEKEVIQVVQANPEVIYVPQYNPATVVVAGGYPSYGYYPAPYPVYYYPYPPGAAFATGLIWGAAITAAWNGGHYEPHYGYGGNNNININRNTTINTGDINRGNVNVGSGNRSVDRSAAGTAWQPDRKPGQVSGAAGRPAAGQRVGDVQGTAGARDASAVGARQPGQGGQAGQSMQAARSNAVAGDRGAAPVQAADRSAPTRGGDAFAGYGSGRDARADSSRGAASRDAMANTGGGRAQSFQGAAGGGGRAAAGGGGRAAGGGGRAAGGGGRLR